MIPLIALHFGLTQSCMIYKGLIKRTVMELHMKARAKINLGLDVLRKRKDGYHELRTVMQTVGLYDEVILCTQDRPLECRSPDIRLKVKTDWKSGGEPFPEGEDNLAYKAAYMLMNEFNICRSLDITLKKHIPVSAGLAGGSADAAAVLIGLNQLFDLKLAREDLMQRGAEIGADVPYCILGGTALAQGIGEKLTPLPAAPDAFVLLVCPSISVSTKFVYTHLNLNRESIHPDIDAQIKAIEEGDLYRMAQCMGNMLEKVTIPLFPVIKDIKNRLLQLNAVNAMMSGSGPAVFALFDDRKKAERAYASLSAENPGAELFLTEYFRPEDGTVKQAGASDG